MEYNAAPIIWLPEISSGLISLFKGRTHVGTFGWFNPIWYAKNPRLCEKSSYISRNICSIVA